MNKNFTKVVEDFTCQKCGHENKGNGYTNHCSSCLTSLHVDLEKPGDRLSKCGGLMPAIGVKLRGGQAHKILFRCEKCSKEIFNKVQPEDNQEKLRELPLCL